MAAVSQTATTLASTPNPHANGYSWDIQAENELDNNTIHEKDENVYPAGHSSLTSQNGKPSSYDGNTAIDAVPRKHGYGEVRSDMRGRNAESGYLSPTHQKEFQARSIHEDVSPSDSPTEPYDGGKQDGIKRTASDMNLDPELDDSKWIHRDKLAKIESEELQAAGIFLPRARDRARSKSANRPRRDQSQDKVNGHGRIGDHASVRSRKNSAVTIDPKTPDLTSVPSWDLRCPEEIAEESYFASNGGSKSISRIPVAKLSPAPIPSEHLERDTLLIRKRENSPADEDSITYPKPRARSGSTGDSLSKASTNGTIPKGGQAKAGQDGKRADSSPKKTTNTPGARKPSAPKAANGAAGRPKTRGGPSHGSTSTGGGTTRPSTRSGELSPGSSRPMEGEPPWMVSAYRPDPRLPPDQQLLPTVAKRLQQEKWEREGKFGSVYDKEFRPLTDEGFLKPPEAGPHAGEADDSRETPEDQAEWPLKNEPKSPSALASRTGSYSTMPKITEKPPMSPIPSPRTPSQPPQPLTTTRVPEPPEDPPEKKSGGCGCCIVM